MSLRPKPNADVHGWRRLFGILGPSTNTAVQPEYEAMRPAGVTNHYSRIFTEDAQAISDETFMAGTNVIASNVLDAVKSVMTCKPDYLVMGMSAITFYGGVEGAYAFEKKVSKAAGVDVSIGSLSTAAALKAYGNIKKIAFLSPYFPAANKEVKRFFEEVGYDVVSDACLRCPTWTSIAQVPGETLFETLRDINSDDVDALVQVGTNLPMAHLAPFAEAAFGKPVIAINTATYWHALRANNINDRIDGFGPLLQHAV